MKSIQLVLLAITLLICFSCQSEPNTGSSHTDESKKSMKIDYPTIAQQICDCVAPLAEINREIEFMVKADRKDEAMEILKEVQKENERTEACLDAIENKYPNNDVIESSAITSLLKKKCPKTEAFLSRI